MECRYGEPSVGDGVPDVPPVGGRCPHRPAVTGVGIRLFSPPSAREVSARSADGGRDATRFLSPSRLRRQPPPRGGLTARRCRAVIARHTPRVLASRRAAPWQSVPLPQISAKIATIPRRILRTYPKYGNFAGNGCAGGGGVLYSDRQSHTRGAPQGAPRCFFGGYAPVGRDPCVPPPGTHFSAGHAGPALRDGMLNRV